MDSKLIGIITTIVFVVVAWYVYALYPFVPNLIFALLASGIAVFTIARAYRNQDAENPTKDIAGLDIARNVVTVIGMLLFFLFFALSVTYGGSATSAEDAASRYAGYIEGEYYLSNHGNFTAVSYDIWIRMLVVERITIPIFLLGFLWNFIYLAKTKGMKYLLTGKESQEQEPNDPPSAGTKLKFILLSIFVFSIAITILIILFSI